MIFDVKVSRGNGESAKRAAQVDCGKRIAQAVAESKREIFGRFMADGR